MPPLTAQELGKDFNLDQSLRFGHLPAVFQEADPKAYLKSYVLIARRVPVFTKKAKRKLIAHPKFFFFDVGVYRTIRPTSRDALSKLPERL